jgi:hypothetical protein
VVGNSQLPTLDSGSFMVSKKLIDKVSQILSDNGNMTDYLLYIFILYLKLYLNYNYCFIIIK